MFCLGMYKFYKIQKNEIIFKEKIITIQEKDDVGKKPYQERIKRLDKFPSCKRIKFPFCK